MRDEPVGPSVDPTGADPFPARSDPDTEPDLNGEERQGPAPGDGSDAAPAAAVNDSPTTPTPLNRQQRRAALRALPTPAAPLPPPLCKAGEHALGPVTGTVKGKVVAAVVMCSTCRRTFQEILDEDPAYAAMYQAWLDAGQPDEWPPSKAIN